MLCVKEITEGSYNDRLVICECTNCKKEFSFKKYNLSKRVSSLCNDCLQLTKKLPLEQVKAKIESFGCKLISGYKNSTYDKIEIECRCGNKFGKYYNDIHKCKSLSCEECRGATPVSKIESKLQNLNTEFTILNRKNIIAKCINCSIQIKTTAAMVIKDSFTCLCQKCATREVAENTRVKHQNIFSQNLSKEGCELLNYNTSLTNAEIKCKCGDVFYRRPNTVNNDDAFFCKNCSDRSVLEKMIRAFLDKNNIKYIESSRSVISPYELDFYIPDANLAIELNGLYWHSEAQGKNKQYHLEKYNRCLKKGIQLLQFWEHEVIDKITIVESIILAKLNRNNKLFARKLELKHVSYNESNLFLEDNHLSGSNHFISVSLGLFLADEIMCLATFSKSRYDKHHDYELIRFASKKGVSVVGGLSKILKNFCRLYNTTNIITYADKRYSNGNSYRQLFNIESETKPNYWYLDKKNACLVSRLMFQKHKLTHLNSYDANLTEKEIMQKEGYLRVWDCGHYVFKGYKL